MHAVAVPALAALGCGGGADGPTTYSVTGVVTLHGKPVGEALVQFTPIAQETGAAGAQLQTDGEGRFDVTMAVDMGRREKHGLPAGEYRVAVTKMEQRGAASLDNPPRNVLPAKYASAQSSPLKATVKAGDENVVELKL